MARIIDTSQIANDKNAARVVYIEFDAAGNETPKIAYAAIKDSAYVRNVLLSEFENYPEAQLLSVDEVAPGLLYVDYDEAEPQLISDEEVFNAVFEVTQTVFTDRTTALQSAYIALGAPVGNWAIQTRKPARYVVRFKDSEYVNQNVFRICTKESVRRGRTIGTNQNYETRYRLHFSHNWQPSNLIVQIVGNPTVAGLTFNWANSVVTSPTEQAKIEALFTNTIERLRLKTNDLQQILINNTLINANAPKLFTVRARIRRVGSANFTKWKELQIPDNS